MTDYKLTFGAVSKLMQGIEVASPVLQILGFKKIAGQGGSDRFRLNISDGVHSHSFAMLATQLNSIIPENKLDNNAVIRADKMISNAVSEKRVLIILDLTILTKGSVVGRIIGNPIQWKEGMQPASSGSGSVPATAPVNGHASHNGNGTSAGVVKAEPGLGSNSFYGQPPAPPASRTSTSANFADLVNMPHMPIKDITPYNNKCPIRARVTNKTPLKTYSNSKGDGKLFSMDLIDDSGEVRMAGFNASVDQYYEQIEINKVYVIRNFAVKPANKNFTSIQHEYELTFVNDTQVVPYLDQTSDIPTISFNFCDIASIEALDNNAMTDVIGVCKRRGELQNITQRSTGKELQKRDIFLVDKTNREIGLTLWGKQAEDFLDDSNPVVALKGCKVSDFSGRSLSCLQSTLVQINPDIHESHVLRGWFDNEGINAESKSLTTGGKSGASGGTQWKLLREANCTEQVDPEKGDYFMSKVTIMSIKRENGAYQACPSATCNKKVVNLDNGMFRCEKCAREYPTFKWRLMLNVNFADCSDHLWATCFQETSEQLLGQSAEIMGPMIKNEAEAFDGVIKEVLFNSYIVKFRNKLDSFNNETRIRTTVQDLHKLNFAEYSRKLVAEIKELAA